MVASRQNSAAFFKSYRASKIFSLGESSKTACSMLSAQMEIALATETIETAGLQKASAAISDFLRSPMHGMFKRGNIIYEQSSLF